MEKYTLKDFIKYSSPCFSCSSKILIQINVYDSINKESFILKPIFYKDFLQIDLKLTYDETLYIKFYYKNNYFITNNLRALTEYLQQFTLYMRSLCDECNSFVLTSELKFNFKSGYIFQIFILKKNYYIKNNNLIYNLISHYDLKKSYVSVINDLDIKSKEIETPLIKIKNKEKLLLKIKNIILFS